MGEIYPEISEYLDILFAYGTFWVYAGIFLACFIENIFPPFPGDTFILAGGGLVAFGRLNLFLCGFSVIVGGMLSVMLLYWYGKKYGRSYFIEKDYKYFSKADILSMEERFQKYGALILILSRFIVGARSALAIVGGMSRYHKQLMFVYSLISYLTFTSLLIYIAMILVENFDKVASIVQTYNYIVWPMLIAVILIYFINKFRAVKREQTK